MVSMVDEWRWCGNDQDNHAWYVRWRARSNLCLHLFWKLGGVALPLSSLPLPLQGALSAPSFMPASQSHNAEMHPWDQDDDDGDVMD